MIFLSPFLLLVLIKNYFSYKAIAKEKSLLLQDENQKNTIVTMQKKLDFLVERIIVLEELATNKNIDLSQKIAQL
jgi:bacterioferritin (cytochrome b1)